MRARTFSTLAALTCLAVSAPALAQDTKPTTDDLPKAEVIFEAARKAMGGKALQEVKSMMVEGSMTIMGQTMNTTAYWARGAEDANDKTVISQSGGGADGGAGSDGETHWANEPMRGYRLLSDEEWKMQSGFGGGHFTFLSDDIKPNDVFETVGVAEFNGKECYKLKAKDVEGNQFMYFDRKEGLPVGSEAEQEGMGGQSMKMTMIFDGWKDYGDIKLFTAVNLDIGGMIQTVLSYDKIELNEVEASTFELPEEVKKLKAASKDDDE